jgi:hypothetical protein
MSLIRWQFCVNLVSIFQKLCVVGKDNIQFIPFVCAFYAFESPLFYNHHNYENNVTGIPSAMGNCQSDPRGRTLFALTHNKALCFIVNCFPSCLFPSIIGGSHIKNPTQLYHFDMNTFKPNFLW